MPGELRKVPEDKVPDVVKEALRAGAAEIDVRREPYGGGYIVRWR